MAQRDPGVIVWWLAHCVDTAVVPAHQVVIEIAMSGADVPRGWLLLARDHQRSPPPSLLPSPPPSPEQPIEAGSRRAADWPGAVADAVL